MEPYTVEEVQKTLDVPYRIFPGNKNPKIAQKANSYIYTVLAFMYIICVMCLSNKNVFVNTTNHVKQIYVTNISHN